MLRRKVCTALTLIMAVAVALTASAAVNAASLPSGIPAAPIHKLLPRHGNATRLAYELGLDKAVAIVLYNDQYGTAWWVYVGKDVGYLVTAAHVVKYTAGVQVQVMHGSYVATGTVVDVDNKHDVAVIKVSKPWAQAKVLPLASNVYKGMKIMVVGYPLEVYELMGSLQAASADPRASFGHVDWVDPIKQIFEIGARTDAGNSGGPILYLPKNAVVGIVSFALHGEVATLYYGTSCAIIEKDLAAWNIPFKVVKVSEAASPTPAGLDYRHPSHAVIAVAACGGVIALLIGVIVGMSVRRGRR